MSAAPTSPIDRSVELLSRWLAVRTSRRSFLGRLARVAVLVATGPTLATLLARQAEARVCGQTGITPKCPTFDCNFPDSVWGWCWYASPGCCANGGLKKVCDCCTTNWPNVHGYCPSGTNVRCIVESCHSDPRVMTITLDPIAGDDASTVAAELCEAEATTAWLCDDDPLTAAVVAPLAAIDGGALLLTDGDRLHPAAIRAIQANEIQRIEHVAGTVSEAAVAEASRYTAASEATALGSTDLGSISVDVARRVLDATGARRVIAVDDTGMSASLAPVVAGLAATVGCPLVVGRTALDTVVDELRPVVVWLVGAEASAWANEVPGGVPVGRSASTAAAAIDAVTRIAATEEPSELRVVLAPAASDGMHAGLAACRGAALLHPDGALGDELAAFLRNQQIHVVGASRVETTGQLSAAGVWEAQASLNHFDVHQLQGVSGQGLPVRSQPLAERELGKARIAAYRGAEAEESEAPYWLSRANPNR